MADPANEDLHQIIDTQIKIEAGLRRMLSEGSAKAEALSRRVDAMASQIARIQAERDNHLNAASVAEAQLEKAEQANASLLSCLRELLDAANSSVMTGKSFAAEAKRAIILLAGHTCGTCCGEGVVDSGGQNPDGSWINIPCPDCDGKRADALLAGADDPQRPLTFRQLQEEQAPWVAHNFPDREAYYPLLGAIEELGELAHAHLKNVQGIRGTPEEHHAAKIDAVADTITFLADYCTASGIDLQDAMETTWAKVKVRDWKNDPINGTPAKEALDKETING